MNVGHRVHRPALHKGEEGDKRSNDAEETVEGGRREHCILGTSEQASRVVVTIAAVTRVREIISAWGDPRKHALARLLLGVGI